MKQCKNCGSRCEESAVVCPSCEKEFEEPQNSCYQQPPVDNQKYKKMGGWLLYCFISMIAVAVGYAIMFFTNVFEILDKLDTLEFARQYPMLLPDGLEMATWFSIFAEIVGLLAIAFPILYLVQLFKRKPGFLRYYQLTIIAGLFYRVFAFIIPMIILGNDSELFGPLSSHIIVLIGGPFAFFLWTLYYCKSVRVRTYMGSDEYMGKAIFAFKNQPPLH